jgi:hypothetical protein
MSTDQELIEEFSEIVDSFDEEKVGAQAALETGKAPEEPEKKEPAPITAKDVAGEKAPEPTAPDRTVLRDKLKSLFPKEENDPQRELEELRAQVKALTAAKVANPVDFLQQQTGLTPLELIQQQNTPESRIDLALQEARAAKEEAERYKELVLEREQERERESVKAGVVEYVKSKGDQYPIVNGSDNQALVYELMVQSMDSGNPLSEDEAMAQVEGKLSEFVEKHAPLLGFTKGAPKSEARETSEASNVTLTPQAAGTTPQKSWEKMTDDERDKALIAML